MSIWADEPPALDCHAHVAPDVTGEQLAGLGDAQVVAVTRSLAEAAIVAQRSDPNVTWGCGAHPGVPDALAAFSPNEFERLLPSFAVVGEVGLDGRRGQRDRQVEVFDHVLRVARREPALVSIHSKSAVTETLDMLERHSREGFVLHWFLGEAGDLDRANRLGCYYSVNAAMSDDAIAALPRERVLPETDFPSTRRHGGGTRPGDTHNVEESLSRVWREPIDYVRRRMYRNLRDVTAMTGAVERVPERLSDLLLYA